VTTKDLPDMINKIEATFKRLVDEYYLATARADTCKVRKENLEEEIRNYIFRDMNLTNYILFTVVYERYFNLNAKKVSVIELGRRTGKRSDSKD
jgi:hypothetical protein